MRIWIPALPLLFTCSLCAQTNRLWYKQPATQWNEALPIGNGRLGGMIFGGVANDRIHVNEDTVWADEKRDRNNPAGAAAIPKVRDLLLQGRVKDAEALADKDIIAIPRRMPPYQPVGDLLLSSPAWKTRPTIGANSISTPRLRGSSTR